MAEKFIDREKLKILWNKGLYAKDIAKVLGCTLDSVYKTAHRLNLPKRKPSRRLFIQDDEAKKRWLIKYYPDMSNETCALILGYSPDYIGRMARKLNLKKSEYYWRELKEYHHRKVIEYHQNKKQTENGIYP